MTAVHRRRRAGAARCGGARHPSPDRARPTRLPGLPRGHRRRFRRPFPHRLCRLHVGRHRSGDAAHPGGARRALSHGRHRLATRGAARRCRACGWWANAPPPACMAPTGWPPTRCWKAWCSAPAWPRTCAAILAHGAVRGTPPAPPASCLAGARRMCCARHDRACRPGARRTEGLRDGAGDHRAAGTDHQRRAGAAQHDGGGEAGDGGGAGAPRESRGGHWRSDYPASPQRPHAHFHDLGRCRHALPPGRCRRFARVPAPSMNERFALPSPGRRTLAGRADGARRAGRRSGPRRRHHQPN